MRRQSEGGVLEHKASAFVISSSVSHGRRQIVTRTP
jgi:hypothetical protein